MTELIYLTDGYRKELTARVVSCVKKGSGWEIVLDQTIFYPQGGGQPSDKGTIRGKHGAATVKHVRMNGDNVVHECSLEGSIDDGERVECTIDWYARYHNMRVHSAGHVVHEAVRLVAPYLEPVKGEHGKSAYIEYKGSLPIDKQAVIEQRANELVKLDLPLKTEFVTLDELKARASYIPEHLPTHKPLRILSIGEYPPIPDGGTQVKSTKEIGEITISSVENTEDRVRVHYTVASDTFHQEVADQSMPASQFIGLLLDAEREAKEIIATVDKSAEGLRAVLLGSKSDLGKLTKQIRHVPVADRAHVGIVVNEVKQSIDKAITSHALTHSRIHSSPNDWFDVTVPGIRPPQGHLHIVTQAIIEITRIFEKIGFTRVRHPEVDWDWYAFESLNMPPNHPARDEWETFFIGMTGLHPDRKQGATLSDKIVLTPHTSNGQVREMEKGRLPIRMINIAKCYRRQSDVSHVPMLHQFEGLYIDKNVSIGDLKGVIDYFFTQYYGPERKSRLRPFHFQFTEPSFEVDINCGACLGRGCKFCKEGWVELAGAGMVHPAVIKNGGLDPNVYNGFAFGWGIERVAMMKSGTKLDDIRLLYSNDVRFLEQF